MECSLRLPRRPPLPPLLAVFVHSRRETRALGVEISLERVSVPSQEPDEAEEFVPYSHALTSPRSATTQPML